MTNTSTPVPNTSTPVPNTINYIIHTKKYGDITMLIDEQSLPLLDSLPKPFYVSYFKNNKAPNPVHTNHPNSPFAGCFYVYTKDKQALHRLIANCPRNLVVDHINHNTLDNRLCNLKVCTVKQNNNNRLNRINDTRKLTAAQIEQILLNPDNLTYNQLATLYSVSNCLISDIKRGKIYTDVCPTVPRTHNDPIKQLPLFLKQEFKRKLLDPNRTISISALARQYGIPTSAAFLIKKGAKWKNV